MPYGIICESTFRMSYTILPWTFLFITASKRK
nr:MAG TPA: hypothetical protein [Bacteriophage sp.]